MTTRQTSNGQPLVYNVTPPTFLDGESGAFEGDANGNLKVAVQASSSSLPGSIATGQVIVAVTGTAVQFPSNTLTQGVIITAHITNSGSVTLGGAAVTNTLSGSGNGVELAAGAALSAAITNTNVLYLNGTAGDWVSFIGS